MCACDSRATDMKNDFKINLTKASLNQLQPFRLTFAFIKYICWLHACFSFNGWQWRQRRQTITVKALAIETVAFHIRTLPSILSHSQIIYSADFVTLNKFIHLIFWCNPRKVLFWALAALHTAEIECKNGRERERVKELKTNSNFNCWLYNVHIHTYLYVQSWTLTKIDSK